ncbi:MAG: 3-phosphoshikimate 1-carboxyvinyltransferase [Chloroflexota bacterium]|nr:MAG: 3-phosphoshikimate 1-carboxyvinyltransferase [Chloroflexota bacterium]
MIARIERPLRLEGSIQVPGDKSISHRAVMLNALADGEARISNFLPGEDCLSTIRCLRALGAAVELAGPQDHPYETVVVSGVGLHGLREPADVLDCGNSGTTMRLLLGILAGQPFFSVLTGDGSLRSRPMGRVTRPLALMGAQTWGRNGGELAPLAIRGASLRPLSYRLPVASAQLKSALLLAGLFADGVTQIVEPGPARDHTERMLQSMGVELRAQPAPGGVEQIVELSPPVRLKPVDLAVPADISSAAFWLVAGSCHPSARLTLPGVGINPTRTGLLDVLLAMGARLTMKPHIVENGEPVADIVVESSALRGIDVDPALVPRLIDELPVLAVAATQATGVTTISGAAELRVKETDRIATTAQELRRLGAEIEERPDGMVISGPQQLRGAACSSLGDHRLGMSLAMAALLADGLTEIDDADAVNVSYPGFWEQLSAVSGGR